MSGSGSFPELNGSEVVDFKGIEGMEGSVVGDFRGIVGVNGNLVRDL